MREIREYPSLFNGNMVRATLDRQKTQTRRLAASRRNCASMPTYLWNRLVFDDALVPPDAPKTFADDGYLHVATRPHPDDPQDGPNWTLERVYPKWKVGDQLWVRETWCKAPRELSQSPHIHYRADYQSGNVPGCRTWDLYNCDTKWRRSAHMPRWASRITLEITNVRVERVQEISEKDAFAEGIPDATRHGAFRNYGRGEPLYLNTPQKSFRSLWDSTTKRGFGWSENPFVWCITFKRIT